MPMVKGKPHPFFRGPRGSWSQIGRGIIVECSTLTPLKSFSLSHRLRPSLLEVPATPAVEAQQLRYHAGHAYGYLAHGYIDRASLIASPQTARNESLGSYQRHPSVLGPETCTRKSTCLGKSGCCLPPGTEEKHCSLAI